MLFATPYLTKQTVNFDAPKLVLSKAAEDFNVKMMRRLFVGIIRLQKSEIKLFHIDNKECLCLFS